MNWLKVVNTIMTFLFITSVRSYVYELTDWDIMIRIQSLFSYPTICNYIGCRPFIALRLCLFISKMILSRICVSSPRWFWMTLMPGLSMINARTQAASLSRNVARPSAGNWWLAPARPGHGALRSQSELRRALVSPISRARTQRWISDPGEITKH